MSKRSFAVRIEINLNLRKGAFLCNFSEEVYGRLSGRETLATRHRHWIYGDK